MDERPYSPGLEGVIAAESAIGLVDGKNGRLLYRGYPIGQLVSGARTPRSPSCSGRASGTRGRAPPGARPRRRRRPPCGSCRATPSRWTRCGPRSRSGAPSRTCPGRRPSEQARALTAFSPSALAAFGRLRQGLEPVEPDTVLDLAGGFLQQLTGRDPDPAAARALDAYFIVGAEHGLNASTFTARVITATRSDLARRDLRRDRRLKGPLHGGAPAEVVEPAPRDRLARARGGSGCARRSAAASGSWASATASIAPTTRGRRLSAQVAEGMAQHGRTG